MSVDSIPQIKRWPFVVGDVLLLGTAAGLAIMAHLGQLPWSTGVAFVITLAVVAGAWLLVWPFLKDHEMAAQAHLQEDWADTLQQVRHVQAVAAQVTSAITHVTTAQDTTRKCISQAEQLAERLQAEHQVFVQALHQSNDKEKRSMQLEIDKMRRSEEESLEVIVHLLDHTFALLQAGRRTGQTGLVEQLTQFRGACLDATRRLGLVAHEAAPGDKFDPQIHRVADASEDVEGGVIVGTIACGYTYRGSGIRPIIVRLESSGASSVGAMSESLSHAIPAPEDLSEATGTGDPDAANLFKWNLPPRDGEDTGNPTPD